VDNGSKPLPLAGVRIVDFTRLIAGAASTRILGSLGADVIRVEWPHYPALDFMRATGAASLNLGKGFNAVNHDKRSITLDMQRDEGKEILRRLVAHADVVAENFRPGTMARWGFGYEELKRIKPDVIYIAASGFGHTGPYRNYRTYGPSAQAFSGLTAMSGLPGREPAGWGYAYLDVLGADTMALAILMALNFRARTGKGQFIDAAQAMSGCGLLGPPVLDWTVNRRPFTVLGNHADHPAAAPHSVYRCRGRDAWCMIACFDEEQWQALRKAMGDPAWAAESRFATLLDRIDHQDELDPLIEQWTVDQDKRELMFALQDVGVPAAMVATAQDLVNDDPQVALRGLYRRIEHPETGVGLVEGNPMAFEKTPAQPHKPAPCIGADNDDVYGTLLEMSADQIAQIRRDGVIT
jgi:crotonobetainyl-CoA:carnitine CoA-transferase CaiB-like acyl-CoA transferase